MPNREIEFWVEGDPIPQGSMRRGRRNKMFHSNKKLLPWREQMYKCAMNAKDGYDFFAPKEKGICLEAFFLLKRPKCGKNRNLHTFTPDLDKLMRAVGDALTGVMYEDDCQICELRLHKRYIVGNEIPGAIIKLRVIG